MAKKGSLHPQSKHHGRYSFPPLTKANPALKQHLFVNEHGQETINFFDPEAVKELNKALLLHHYELQYWDIPNNNLCPPIPGRADHLLYLKDLLDATPAGKTGQTTVLDIGTGANCIYPLIGASLFGWHFVGSEIAKDSVEAARKNVTNNTAIAKKIDIRLQKDKQSILNGIIRPDEYYHLTMCNPPFHASAKEAEAGTKRKLKNLKGKVTRKIELNFGGQSNELWYPGGEIQFVKNYIRESKAFGDQVLWFSCLISKEDNLHKLKKMLQKQEVKRFRVLDMAQGNKKSRILAWSY
jgi:23S rRNA (adenine1618-N6)-methyltransferase